MTLVIYWEEFNFGSVYETPGGRVPLGTLEWASSCVRRESIVRGFEK